MSTMDWLYAELIRRNALPVVAQEGSAEESNGPPLTSGAGFDSGQGQVSGSIPDPSAGPSDAEREELAARLKFYATDAERAYGPYGLAEDLRRAATILRGEP